MKHLNQEKMKVVSLETNGKNKEVISKERDFGARIGAIISYVDWKPISKLVNRMLGKINGITKSKS